MLKQKLIEEFTARISEVLAASPAKDLEKNLKATLAALFAKLDLVTREEFDVQAQVLARTREQLGALEARLAKLEQGPSGPPASTGDTPAADGDA
ncbi:MAG: accessory factor UbiK family protein [Thiobacillaceae bacterium]